MDNNNIFNNSNNSSQNMAPVNQQIYTGSPSVSFSNSIYSMPKKEDHKYLTSMKQNYWFFLIASVIYGVIFSFSISLNPHGITSPLFAIATFVYILVCTQKAEVKINRKTSICLCTAMTILGINLCYTIDRGIIFWDYIFIFTLALILTTQNFFDISKWGLGKYVEALFCSIFGSFEHLPSIISDGKNYVSSKKESNKKNAVILYISIGILITIPLLFIVLSLLSSADKFFGDFINNVLIKPFMVSATERFVAIFLFFTALIGSYTLMHWFCAQTFFEGKTERKKSSAIIAITVTSILNLVYVIFSGFQIFYLFLGEMTLPEDYTFASYAREGFFQLVAVCIINMLLVLIFINVFENSKVLKFMLALTSGCTFIMIASSLMRMIMYISMYQLTYTRLFVLWALAVIFFGMCGTVIYIFKNDFPILKYFVAVVICLYCVYAYSRPAYIIAKNNLSTKFCEEAYTNENRYTAIDFYYFTDHYSIEAIPAVTEAIARENNEYFTHSLDTASSFIKVHYNRPISRAAANGYHTYSDTLTSFRQFNFSEYKGFNASNKASEYKHQYRSRH